jgi:hypothetical protein
MDKNKDDVTENLDDSFEERKRLAEKMGVYTEFGIFFLLMYIFYLLSR